MNSLLTYDNMHFLDKLIETFLTEAVALTKGSQRVMNDKKLVQALAETVRDDAMINPSAFPAGSKNNFKKATDEAVAQWFLENIDKIEREGYNGAVYSRDGANSDWIVRRYIAGSHTWEDLTGVMNMNLADWYILKNRNLLDANHKELSKFKGVRDLGFYMTTHYQADLEQAREAAKVAAERARVAKMSKHVKLVDNDDYRIYTTLNRSAACALGLGTQWCTANSQYAGHYHTYSNAAMLFQLFPYSKEADEKGKRPISKDEKYQFDAGGFNFMDITDHRVPAAKVRERFPYIFTDLEKGILENKTKMEQQFEELSTDPEFQAADYKIKKYELDNEIKKLHGFVNKGYFTDEQRPTKQPDEPASIEAQPNPQQGQTAMEMKDLMNSMLEEISLGHIVQQYKPIDKSAQKSPLTHGGEIEEANFDSDQDMRDEPRYDTGANQAQDPEMGSEQDYNDVMADSSMHPDEAEELVDAISSMQNMGLSKASKSYTPEELMGMRPQDLKRVHSEVMGTVEEDDMQPPADAPATPMPQGGAQGGSMPSGGGGGGQYPSGTAPTMPESINNKGRKTMENVDKDVAAMLTSLKKYDKLTESCAPVLMARPKIVETGQPWETKEEVEEEEAEEKEEVEEATRLSGRNPYKAGSGNFERPEKDASDPAAQSQRNAIAADAKTIRKQGGGNELNKPAGTGQSLAGGGEVYTSKATAMEGADPEVLDWMSRFSKLGNMKGYGR